MRNKIIFKRTGDRECAYFCSGLATLLKTDITLLAALEIMADKGKTKLGRDILNVRERIFQGSTLSEAMQICPESFPVFFRSMVYVGERSGGLPEMLETLGKLYKKKAERSSKLTSMMIYPCIILLLLSAVIVFVSTFVLPTLQQSILSADSTMPAFTVFIIRTGEVLTGIAPLVLAVSAAGVGIVLFYRKTNADFCQSFDGGLYSIPIFGRMLLWNSYASSAGALSLLLSGGITITEALDITSNITSNHYMQSRLLKTRESILRGENFTQALTASGAFEPAFLRFIHVGEQTGRFAEHCLFLQEHYERKLEYRIERVFHIMEPVILLILGIIVGAVMLSVLLPILASYEAFSAGM